MTTQEDKILLSDLVANCLALLIRKLEHTGDQTDRKRLLSLAEIIYETPLPQLESKQIRNECQMIRRKYEKIPNCPSWQAIINEANQLHKDLTGEDLTTSDQEFDWF